MKTIKCILREYKARMWNDLRWLQVGPMVDFCKHGKETLVFCDVLSNII
jgi:hypothetical protein